MITFPSSLQAALKTAGCVPVWAVRLYYGDESSYTALSDTDRTIDSVFYRGLVTQWGEWVTSWDWRTFQASVGSMGLTVSNKPGGISNGRFSDLFASQNYVNRKWVLLMGAAGVPGSDYTQIAEGVIGDDIGQTDAAVTFRLMDYLARDGAEVPANRINATDHPNAPENNLGAPIPIPYGSFDRTTSLQYYNQFFVAGRFPAIISDKQNDDGEVEALPDINSGSAVLLKQLRTGNVYMESGGKYLACDPDNVTINDETPSASSDHLIVFSGLKWYHRYVMVDNFTSSASLDGTANIVDDDLSTSQSFTRSNVSPTVLTDTIDITMPKIQTLGDIPPNESRIKSLMYRQDIGGTPDNWNLYIASGATEELAYAATGDYDTEITRHGFISGATLLTDSVESTGAVEGLTLRIKLVDNDTDTYSYDVYDWSLVVSYVPPQVFTKVFAMVTGVTPGPEGPPAGPPTGFDL